ncbi:MAG: chemotaxis protein CheW [Dehalococcoidia bacterium]
MELDKAIGAERQLVVFDLAREAFGIGIEHVREIIRLETITHVPNAPAHVEGVINLRGKVIPVVDLRRRLGLGEAEVTKESRIVVVEVDSEDVGMIVDAVTEVVRVAEGAMEPASPAVATAESYYVQGIANLTDKLIILLDINRVLRDDDADAESAAA